MLRLAIHSFIREDEEQAQSSILLLTAVCLLTPGKKQSCHMHRHTYWIRAYHNTIAWDGRKNGKRKGGPVTPTLLCSDMKIHLKLISNGSCFSLCNETHLPTIIHSGILLALLTV